MNIQGDIDDPLDPGKGHEVRDVNFGNVMLIGAALLALVFVVMLVTVGILELMSSTPVASKLPASRFAEEMRDWKPPEPRLESSPASTLAEVRTREDSLLNAYHWMNKDSGIARIPIERAMEIIAARGLPFRDTSHVTKLPGGQ